MHSQQPPGVVQNWSTLQCSKQNTEQCGYDHAPVTWGRISPVSVASWPLVVPHPLSFPAGGGGVGDRHLVNPNFSLRLIVLLLGDCVVGHYHLHPLHSWQDILLTFAEMELDSTTIFPPGTSVMFIRSTGEPVLAQVFGHSEHGDAYRRITYDRDGKTVLHDRASVRRLSLPRAPSPPRPALGVWSPKGGWVTVTW